MGIPYHKEYEGHYFIESYTQKDLSADSKRIMTDKPIITQGALKSISNSFRESCIRDDYLIPLIPSINLAFRSILM
jgi:hypothetical protein